jgi:hypothetical protein
LEMGGSVSKIAEGSMSRPRGICSLALLLLPLAGCSLVPPLRRALKGKPLVIDLAVDEPASAWHLDVEELSARLRRAGAATLVAPLPLLEMVTSEQASARGSFPGPLPVLCDVALDAAPNGEWATLLGEAREAGAVGVAVRCADAGGADALRGLLEAAAAAELECLVVAGDGEVLDVACAAGAAAVACAYAEAEAASGDEAASAVVLGAWDGEDEELARLRGVGFPGLLLLDGVGGDVAAGAAYCESRVAAHRSKASKVREMT